MAEQNVNIETITTSPTTLTNLNSITILNGSADQVLTLGVSGSGKLITLKSGQTLNLQASTGFSLPSLVISGTSLNAQIVTT